MKETVNEDTYQTLKEFRIDPPPHEKAIEPLWKDKSNKKKSPYKIFVASPVHSDVSMHYTQALLEFQKLALDKGVTTRFNLMKSSLVTQGRNLCVSGFLESNYTHLLFVDSDIWFHSPSIFKMIEKDKDIISIAYPLKTMMWDKLFERIKQGRVEKPEDLKKYLNTYPMKVADPKNIILDNGVMEVTHSPTGCMLIKRSVFDKMIKAYPDKGIVQKTVINGKYVDRPHMWNFFDTLHDPETKTYLGEDFSFCKLWKDLGGKCYAYVDAPIAHIGEHAYEGRFSDELISKS
jgi:glycosyltransferase involved in cell wall biosynthesis|tara:strand:+ start:1195 stop:2064 length:870 start_codon:yes stop_codon:yes gene_type:complete